MVSETRNHLIAAVQNISSAHGNLKPVNIPYCTMEDLEVSFHHFYILNENFIIYYFTKIWFCEMDVQECQRGGVHVYAHYVQ